MALHPTAETLMQLVRAANAPPLSAMPVADARREALQAVLALALDPPEQAVAAEDVSIPGPGGPIPARIYRAPDMAAGPAPAVVFFHGGGWVVGDLETHDHLCRHFAVGSKARVVAVDYRLAPEHRFPAAVEDALAAVRWVATEAKPLGVDASRLAVCGDSAGGNLATVVALHAGRDGVPALRLQVLIYPVVDIQGRSDSYARNGEHYLLPSEAMDFFIDSYAPDVVHRGDWRASPLLVEGLDHVAPALIYTAEHDVLHDEGAAYVARLRAAGVVVIHQDIIGHMHGFITSGKLLPVAAETIAEINAALTRALAAA